MLFFCQSRSYPHQAWPGKADSVNSVLPWKVGRPKPTPHLRLCARSPRSGRRQGETWQPTCLDTTKRKSCIQGPPCPPPQSQPSQGPAPPEALWLFLDPVCLWQPHTWFWSYPYSYNQKMNKQKQRPPEPPGLPSLHTSCPVTQAARDPWPRPSSFSPRKASPEARISCGCLDSGAPVHSPHLPRGLDLQGLQALLLVEGEEPVCPSRKCMVKCQSQLQCK
ncbi:unnamed protein product [Nyctereutes procyonoides]|uniref:(raccoon dog) hypothetical protein n=1 Tax=Nyctereutes procyonoides TaxID=34880 RepID=A0A811ZQQ5_NYCPR|nr:unnamed protein product [Nyctereutes procyonoides]